MVINISFHCSEFENISQGLSGTKDETNLFLARPAGGGNAANTNANDEYLVGVRESKLDL